MKTTAGPGCYGIVTTCNDSDTALPSTRNRKVLDFYGRVLRRKRAPMGDSGGGWTVHTLGDGLAGSYSSAIAFAPDGAIWLGSARFEPTRMENTRG